MPFSSQLCKGAILGYISSSFDKNCKILDVGAGSGTYGILLKNLGYLNVDCVEIYSPYIVKYDLKNIYVNVHNEDILTFNMNDKFYDLILLGDVLEHIDERKSIVLINKLFNHCKTLIVSVPYNSEQGEYDGNIYETHLQSKLDNYNFNNTYPEFVKLAEGYDPDNLNSLGQIDHIAVWIWNKEA